MSLSLEILQHGVVIPSRSPDALPAGAETAAAAGLRMLYYGWPGMTRTADGDLLVTASERLLHVDPYGRHVMARSSDQGHTWSEREVIFNSAADDRDISLRTLPDGTVVATWFCSMIWTRRPPFTWMRPEWEEWRQALGPDDSYALLDRGWLRRSHDGGKSWERTIYPTPVGQHAGPSVMHNGDLVYVGRQMLDEGCRLVCCRSTDGGLSWAITGTIPDPRFYVEETDLMWTYFGENHLLEVAPGELICALRGSRAAGRDLRHLHLTRSLDGGCTWSEPEDLGVFGFPPYLLRTQAGQILCAFSDRSGRGAIRAIVSDDDGATWDTDHVLIIREDFTHGSPELGYPVLVETEPGEFFCIYYASPLPDMPGYEQLDPADWGILSTRFRLRHSGQSAAPR